jgi:hypothetical protein
MNRGAVLWALVALAAAGMAAAALTSSRGLRNEVDTLRGQVERMEAREKADRAPARTELEELRQELSRVEAKAADAAAAAGRRAPGAPGAAVPAVTEDDLRTIVDERLEEKLQARKEKGQGGGDRKMPLHDLGKELGLDPQTQGRVEQIANATKKEIFALIRTPRPDGSDFAAEIVQTFLGGEPQKAQQIFARLFTEKVPGTDTTYAAGVGAIQDRAREGLHGVLGDAVFTRYRHMNVHPENIETGFDPWAEYVKEKGLGK